jgi:hypothetical protein
MITRALEILGVSMIGFVFKKPEHFLLAFGNFGLGLHQNMAWVNSGEAHLPAFMQAIH